MTDNPQPLRIPIGRNVTYAVRGMPEVANQYGPGFLVPTEVSLTYRSTEDSQLGRFHAYVKGHWHCDGDEIGSGLPLPGQHYYGDPDGWPDWLAAEARLHDPNTAVPSAPADRAAILREAADTVARLIDDGEHDPDCLVYELRHMTRAAEKADEAQQPETQAGLKRAHVALAAQAGRDQAAVARVRAYLASQTDALPEGYPVAVPVADVLAALNEQPAVVSQPGKEG